MPNDLSLTTFTGYAAYALPYKCFPASASCGRRIVQVFVVDPNKNVPIKEAVIFWGDPKITDLTDEEIFHEIELKRVLDDYNLRRVLILDRQKSRDGEDVYLEPLKIRDACKIVKNIAEF